MATLAISKEFLPDYGSLPQDVRKKVDALFSKFAEHTHAGIHLEKLGQARDPRARSVRIDQAWRGVVIAPEKGDAYVLVRVLHHDKAYAWMERNVFGVNQATGALEIEDVTGIEAVVPALGSGEYDGAGTLFPESRDKDILQLGIPEKLLPTLHRISTDEELEGLSMYLPQGQADALNMIAAGYTAEEAYSELVAGEDPGVVDRQDVGAAVERPASRSMFYVVQEATELVEMLSRPFDLWRTFLHPTQRSLAYRQTYSGSARVTGGAGTGKTVVAMHRAKALADRVKSNGSKQILFTTFTKNLARSIQENLKLLGGPEILEKVDVVSVDKLSSRFVRDEESSALKICSDQVQEQMWDDVADELGIDEVGPLSSAFVRHEWQQVVLAHGISSRAEYFAVPRMGRGVRLDRRQRAAVWDAIEEFTNRLVDQGQRTYLQMADAAAGYVSTRSVKPYSHVIIDEAQDLHPAQWRMLRAAVAEGPDDMFIVGDTHQRIYDNRISLSRLGINVRGRAHRLRLNYRTTHEILRWSLGLLSGETFDDLDEGVDTLVGYRSQLHGPPPTAMGYPSRSQELGGLVGRVREWIASGVEPEEIGIAARTHEVCGIVANALSKAGLEARELRGDEEGERGGVEVGTMHRMKGLEYRCVAIVNAGQDRIPLTWVVTPESDDPTQHRNDLLRERSLLYVACTRARDDLRVSWTGAPSPFIEPLLTESMHERR